MTLQSRNQAYGITGLLVYNDGPSMQCFEKREGAVFAVCVQSRRSKRHGDNIADLLNEFILRRSFLGRHMAFSAPSESAVHAVKQGSGIPRHQKVSVCRSDITGLAAARLLAWALAEASSTGID